MNKPESSVKAEQAKKYVRKYFPCAVDRSNSEWIRSAEYMRRAYSKEELAAILEESKP